MSFDRDGRRTMQHTPDVQLISSRSFPGRNSFSYWADVVAQTFVPLQCDTADRDGFFGELRHRQIGCIAVTEVRASAMVARRTKAKIAAAPRDDAIVVLQGVGSCNAGQRAEIAQLQSGGGAIATADEPYFFISKALSSIGIEVSATPACGRAYRRRSRAHVAVVGLRGETVAEARCLLARRAASSLGRGNSRSRARIRRTGASRGLFGRRAGRLCTVTALP